MKPQVLSQEQLDTYQRDGYLLIKNVINPDCIDEMMDFVAHVIVMEAKVDPTKHSKEEILNKVLIELKRKNPSSSSWVYQTILNSFKLKKFFINIDIVPMVMDLLNVEDERNLGTVSPAFRYDIPGDTKNIRTWHQDGNYFLENQKGEDHLVVWIPMNRARKENGSVLVAPGTHNKGKLESIHEHSEGFKSEQFKAPEEQYADSEIGYIEAEKGDIAFINMDLLHSSGVNITDDEVRYTAQIRFNQINRDEYRPVFLKAEYPEYSRNVQSVL